MKSMLLLAMTCCITFMSLRTNADCKFDHDSCDVIGQINSCNCNEYGDCEYLDCLSDEENGLRTQYWAPWDSNQDGKDEVSCYPDGNPQGYPEIFYMSMIETNHPCCTVQAQVYVSYQACERECVRQRDWCWNNQCNPPACRCEANYNVCISGCKNDYCNDD